MPLSERVIAFTGKPQQECARSHQLQHTGAVFYQSVGLMQCGICYGWQLIRKPVKTKCIWKY